MVTFLQINIFFPELWCGLLAIYQETVGSFSYSFWRTVYMKNYLALCPSYKLKLYFCGLKHDSMVCYNLEDMSLEVALRLGSYLCLSSHGNAQRQGFGKWLDREYSNLPNSLIYWWSHSLMIPSGGRWQEPGNGIYSEEVSHGRHAFEGPVRLLSPVSSLLCLTLFPSLPRSTQKHVITHIPPGEFCFTSGSEQWS